MEPAKIKEGDEPSSTPFAAPQKTIEVSRYEKITHLAESFFESFACYTTIRIILATFIVLLFIITFVLDIIALVVYSSKNEYDSRVVFFLIRWIVFSPFFFSNSTLTIVPLLFQNKGRRHFNDLDASEKRGLVGLVISSFIFIVLAFIPGVSTWGILSEIDRAPSAVSRISNPCEAVDQPIWNKFGVDIAPKCESDWTLFNGACYKHFHNRAERLEHYMAELKCNSYGAHLSTVSSQEELDFLGILVDAAGILGTSWDDVPLLAPLRNPGNDTWFYNFDEPSEPFMKWCPLMPNNYRGRENCVLLVTEKHYIDRDYREEDNLPCLDDAFCEGGYSASPSKGFWRYVCKKTAVAEKK